jgi:transposase
MFVKLARSRGHTYAQLVESFRDDNGQPRHRHLLTLGRADENGGQVDKVLQSLLKARGHGPRDTATPEVQFESALALGDVWALDQLWRELGFDALHGVFRQARFTSPVEQAIRVMVFNRLCDADSKLGVLRWLQTVSIPGVEPDKLTHQHLLRSMDALMDHQGAVDDCVAHLLRPLIDDELSVVYYDLTTIRSEGLSVQDGDVRHFGMSKEGMVARQCLLGVVQTADGMPIYHEVFDGNSAEAPTMLPRAETLRKVLTRYPHIRRLVMVADRGLLSVDNLAELTRITLPSGQPLEFILAVPGRRYGEFVDLLQPMHDAAVAASEESISESTSESISESRWEGHRLVVAHDPVRAQEQTALRASRIAALQARAEQLAGKLDGQDAGDIHRGRKLSDSGAKARFFHEVAEAHLSRIIKVDLKSERFTYDVDAQALARAQMMDGKLLLVTNVADLKPTEIVQRYKSLADIERGFKVLKSEIEIAPVFHRLPERIRAHASICFMALILYRVMRQRLKAAGHPASPETALTQLRRIQRQSVSLNQGVPITGVSNINRQQAELFSAMKLRKPVADTQLSLL